MFLPNSLRPPRHRLPHDVGDLRDLVDAHERIHFGKKLRQFVAKTLRQATGNNQPLTAIPRFADFRRFENRVHAFLLRGINERAGVYDHHVRLGGVVGDFHAVLEQRPEHDFSIHQVLGATERNQADADGAFLGIFLRHKPRRLRHGGDAGNPA